MLDIQIKHLADIYSVTAKTFNVDQGPLALPAHLKLDGHTIKSYADQVVQYERWLEECCNAGDQDVMEKLELIYADAQRGPVVLGTVCVPEPYVTHAHKIRDLIIKLGG